MDGRQSAAPARFARQHADTIELTDRRGQTISLTLSADRDADLAAEQLAAAAARGIKIRTRALATTLFARLLLSDLFLHGIGGAKYDQVTDDIARRFFGFSLPEFATASATLRSADRPPRYADDRFHPRRPPAAPRADVSSRTIPVHQRRRRGSGGPRKSSLARHRQDAAKCSRPPRMPSPRQCLASSRSSHRSRDELERRRNEIEHRLAVDSILNSREYSFCLFPREHFARLLSD